MSPSRSTSDFGGVGINVSSATAKLVLWANGPSVIMYEMCSGMAPRVSDSMTIQAVEYSVVAPDGSAYTAFKDSYFPAPLHLGFVGCQILYQDPNLARAVATTYRVRVDYIVDKGVPSGTQTAIVSGPFVSSVQPTPLMAAVSVVDDTTDTYHTVQGRRPVTFTATGLGGTTPYEFQWRLNGVLLRDWDTNSTLVWDATTLAGRTVLSGSYTMSVNGRSHGGTASEANGTVSVLLLLN